MDLLDYSNNDEVFAYFDIQNLSIDHSLSSKEIEEYKDLIFSPNGLRQVYFKDSCDIKTILLLKNLLTISDYVDNFKVEKYVLLDLDPKDYKTLLNETYEYPSTWKLPCEIENDNIVLLDIPKIRFIDTFATKLKGELSPLEQVMKVYDTIKMFDYDPDADLKYHIIIKDKKANSRGMNKLFAFILKKFDFKVYVDHIKGDEDTYITLVDIKDDKYNIDGIYVFDPSMDTLSKEKYRKDDVRRINYNFFCLNLSRMNLLKYKERLQGILSIMSLDDYEYASEKMDICQDNMIIRENQKILSDFGLSFEDLYNRINNNKEIDIKDIIKINDVLYPNKIEKYNEYLLNNYNSRKRELFEKNTLEELEEYIENEEN